MTITEFLLARIAEDEAVARTEILAEQRVGGADHGSWWRHSEGHIGFAGGASVQVPDAMIDHIARHDPARVLAECEAKRRIVEREPSVCSGYEDQDEYDTHYPDPEWSFCDGCAAAESADADWQRTLRVLAAVHADHPDFQPEWLAT